MSSTSLGGMAEKYFTQASVAFSPSQPEADSSSQSLRSLSLKKPELYPQFVPQNREDYPSAVEDDDLDASIEVLPIRTTTSSILYTASQGLPSAENCFNIFDDETSFDRCHAVLYDPKDSDTQYFINDEDLFERLNSDSDYFNQYGGDHEGDSTVGELSEEDILFGSGWDSDETVTDSNAHFLLHIRRERFYTAGEEKTDLALRDTQAVDGAKYFDADDLFEREEEEMMVYGRDGGYLEDWDL